MRKMEYCWKLCVNVRSRLKKTLQASRQSVFEITFKGYIDIGFESRINAKNVV